MLYRIGAIIAAVSFTVAAVTGCGSHHHVGVRARAAASRAASSRDAKAAQDIVKTCLSKDGFITHAEREELIGCMAPAGNKARAERCLEKAALQDGLLTRAERARFITGAADCVVKYR